MKMTVDVFGVDRDLVVTDPAATVGDLLAAVVDRASPPGQDWCLVEVAATCLRRLPDDHALAEVGLRDGARLRVVAAQDAPRGESARVDAPPHAAVGVVGGLDAGRVVTVRPGRHLVGRGPGTILSHPTVSGRHARLDVGLDGSVAVRDLGSRNGTLVDGAPAGTSRRIGTRDWARIGAQLVRATTPVDDRATIRDGALHRPPRVAAPPLPGAVAVPRLRTGEDRSLPTLPLAATLGSVAAGAVMYAVTGSVLMLAMSGMAALAALASGVAARRRAGRDRRRVHRADRAALADFAAEVGTAVARQRDGLRARHPDAVEVVRRATTTSVHVWERRADHDDLLVGTLGYATRPWRPLLGGGDGEPREPRIADVVSRLGHLVDAPVPVRLGEVVGIVGDRGAALALARWLLVEAATHHGPADLSVALVVDDPTAVADWDWAKWLPHLRDPSGRPAVGVGEGGASLLADIDPGRSVTDGPSRVVVLDGVATVTGPGAPAREVLRRVGGIVVAERADQLPASCTTMVRLHGPDGRATVVEVATGARREDVLATGLSVATATTAARGLAGLQDPERRADDRLPTEVGLRDLAVDPGSGLACALGVGPGGPVVVDLERDGPHALVAGTTGAGKSELLRTLVAGLASAHPPDRVNFVLVDYKGGSAFDRCAELPHVVGLVTDLDDDLAERALVCLRAELSYRERVLRRAGAADLATHRRRGGEPLPSLVVCIDEFAALAAELPDFMSALVGIAQRGRSLGVHLVLATQRPAGVVNDDIRANTDLRIALRVQDRQDSMDVIEVGDAALLPRDVPGRGLVRFGPGEVVAFQAARVTGPAGRRDVAGPLVRPFGLLPDEAECATGRGDTSALDEVVARTTAAHLAGGGRPPRQPWPPPLPTDLDLQDVVGGAVADRLDVALADEPAAQRRVPTGWELAAGNLAVVGVAGSGTTTALRSLGVAAAGVGHELWAIDADRGGLAGLEDLPSCGGVVRASEVERLRRLLARLCDEVERRRDGGGAAGPIVVLVDGFDRLVTGEAFDDPVARDLERLVVDGASVGVHVAVAVGRPGALPTRLAAAIPQRWVLRLADPHDAALLGAPAPSPRAPAGRALEVPGGRLVQVGRVQRRWEEVVAAAPAAARPEPVTTLPRAVGPGDVGPAPAHPRGAGPWRLPVGVGADRLEVATLDLHAREHALVVGPSRSGRSTVLAGLAAMGVAAGVRTVAVAPRGGPLARMGIDVVAHERLATVVAAATGPLLVLVDDADTLVDDRSLVGVLGDAGDAVHVVAAARADLVRGAYGSWLRGVAAGRVGVLLEPDRDLDPDLFGVTLPRRPLCVDALGRGWLVQAGRVQQVQFARPAPFSRADAA